LRSSATIRHTDHAGHKAEAFGVLRMDGDTFTRLLTVLAMAAFQPLMLLFA
jgi:hypothetical protein